MRSKSERYKPTKTVSGILMMILHALSVSIYYIISKQLTQSLHPFQVAFLYKFAILLAIIPWCLHGDFRKNLKTKRIGTHVARGAFSLFGSLCFFVAIKSIPTTNAAAITYLEPILILIIGSLYFKEDITKPNIVMVIFGVVGAMLIIKPGFVSFNIYYIYLFMALIFWALNCTVIKMLGSTERSKAQIFYVMLFSSMFSMPLASYEWKPLELWHMKYIFAIAACYLIHTIAFFKAFKFASMTSVMPFDYCRLVFTAILSFFILKEVPDKYSLIGYALIICGGLYSILHETAKSKKKLVVAQKSIIEANHDQI